MKGWKKIGEIGHGDKRNSQKQKNNENGNKIEY